ncbi:MAG TPA: glycoside hydrolase family 2 TIM barrel-domain containing protein [Propionibacteriaceae bacterium]|nr:glycoside hydrolase family 2 TIM barrel-domain containing protein [Propionibacteriaceae bacterium]
MSHLDDFSAGSNTLPPRARLASNAPSLSLSGRWAFRLAPGLRDLTEGFESPGFDDASWDRIAVPSCWQMTDIAGEAPYGRPAYTNVLYPIPLPQPGDEPRVPDANPTGEYRHVFELPASFEGHGVIVRFDGVDSCLELFCNGQRIGHSKGSRLAVEFDLTDVVQPGANVLAARVNQWSDATFIEDQDMWWVSGIFRDVTLLARPEGGIDDLFVHADVTPEGGRLLIDGPTGATVRVPELGLVGATNVAIEVADIGPWTAETPRLYDVEVITGPETVTLRVGFRTVEIVGDQIQVNGTTIRFDGVNRHEWHPVTGRTLDLDTMRADLDLMKRHNINAIRTSHYPPDPRFLDLCDEYGFWVMLECDLETHGFTEVGWAGTPVTDERWFPALLNRIERTVERDKNHPCIISWSMGNESHFGEGIALMNAWTKLRDPGRFTHYEGDYACQTADVWSQMYTPLPVLEAIATGADLAAWWEHPAAPQNDRQLTIPHLLCEYAHAMGNGPGELRDYADLFDAHPKLHGGFIWEWLDHGVEQRASDGELWYAYGGDFGEPLHDGNFVIDGLAFPDRTPSPGLAEFAKVIEPVRIRVDGDAVRLENRLSFADTSRYDFTWTLTSDGTEVASGTLDVPAIAPGASAQVPLPDLPACEGEGWVTVSARLASDARWASAGHEVAFGQGLVSPGAASPLDSTVPPSRTEAGWALGPGRFDASGHLVGLGDARLVAPTLDLFRAGTDNDWVGWARMWASGAWEKAGLHRLVHRVDSVLVDGDALVVVTHDSAAAHSRRFETTWRWTSDGDRLHLALTTSPVGDWPFDPSLSDGSWLGLPRIGVRLGVPTTWDRATWFGRGPHESYIDSHESARIGRWSATIDELQTPYVRPQENGNRAGVRWAEIAGEGGGGVRIDGDAEFNLTLRPWTSEALHEAAHTTDLRPDKVAWLNLDFAQHALGSAACGGPPKPDYWLRAQTVTLGFAFTPIAGGHPTAV